MRLAEASPVTGGLVFHILQGDPRAGRGRRGPSAGKAAPGGTNSGRPGRARNGDRAIDERTGHGVPPLLPAVRGPRCRCAGLCRTAGRRRGLRPGAGRPVTAAALAFMAPRTLEPVPVSELTVWGLRGLTALDPQLTAELQRQRLRLRLPDRVAASRPAAAGRGSARPGRSAFAALARGRLDRLARGAPGRHARHHAELLRRDVQPSRSLFALRAAGRGGRGPGAALGQRRPRSRPRSARGGAVGGRGDRRRPGALAGLRPATAS